jgi:hypothetical protein
LENGEAVRPNFELRALVVPVMANEKERRRWTALVYEDKGERL